MRPKIAGVHALVPAHLLQGHAPALTPLLGQRSVRLHDAGDGREPRDGVRLNQGEAQAVGLELCPVGQHAGGAPYLPRGDAKRLDATEDSPGGAPLVHRAGGLTPLGVLGGLAEERQDGRGGKLARHEGDGFLLVDALSSSGLNTEKNLVPVVNLERAATADVSSSRPGSTASETGPVYQERAPRSTNSVGPTWVTPAACQVYIRADTMTTTSQDHLFLLNFMSLVRPLR